MTGRDPSLVSRALLLIGGMAVGGVLTAGLVIALVEAARGSAPTEAMPAPRFVAESTGMDHVYQGGFEYFVGGGVAVLDCNADLLPDLYLAGGTGEAGLFVNRSEIGGELVFERVTSPEVAMTSVSGAYPIDVDSDGIIDLAVLRVGENSILRGQGDCGFEPANGLWNLEGGDGWTVSFSATWEDGQNLPTLAFGNYLDLEVEDRSQCDDHIFMRPDGDRYRDPVRLSPGWCTLSILFSDWGRRGSADLRMTNDRHYYTDGQEQLWRIEAGRAPELYSLADGWKEMQIWGMGIASHDLTGNGLPEVYLTSQGDNKLQTLTAPGSDPSYEDMALAVGVTAHRPFIGETNRPSTAWHAEFGDVNNDGFIDLFVTKGNVEAMPEFAMRDPNNLLLGQADGTFVEAAAEANLLDYARSRGAALVDLNLDGRLDVVVVERQEPVRVWRNTGDAGNWLAVEPSQGSPNNNAIGSWIEVRLGTEIIRSEVTIGGGHAGGELGPIHFGLGSAGTAEVRITWPDGEQSTWHEVTANQVVRVDRESDALAKISSE